MFKKQADSFKWMHHFMIDMETLDVGDNPVIVQIGCTLISPTPNKKLEIVDTFNKKISINAQLPMGRSIRPDTLVWWSQQDPEVYRSVFTGETEQLASVIRQLDVFFKQILKDKTAFIWANGALADIFWLKNIYKMLKANGQTELNYPFDYNKEKCFRTLVFGLKDYVYNKYKNEAKHDALADAIWQSEVLMDFINNYDEVVIEMDKTFYPARTTGKTSSPGPG